MVRTFMFVGMVAGLAGLAIGGALPGLVATRALGAEGGGSVAGWVYWSYCPPYPLASGVGTGSATAVPSGPVVMQGTGPEAGSAQTSPAAPGPGMPIYQPIPANGALVALQG